MNTSRAANACPLTAHRVEPAGYRAAVVRWAGVVGWLGVVLAVAVVALADHGAAQFVDDLESYTDPPYDPIDPAGRWTWDETLGAKFMTNGQPEAAGGGRALLYTGTSGGSDAGHALFREDHNIQQCLDDGRFTFDFYIEDFATYGSKGLEIGFVEGKSDFYQGNQKGGSWKIRINTLTGAVGMEAYEAGGDEVTQSTSQNFALTLQEDTLYHFELWCPGGFATAIETTTGWYRATNDVWSVTTEDNYGWGHDAEFGNSTGARFWFDNIGHPGIEGGVSGPGPQQIGAQTTVNVTDLVGFDVDRTGSNIIARTDSGVNVRTYSAASLDAFSSASTPDCLRPDGVFASSQLVAFLDCDGTGSVEAIRIRTPPMGPPGAYFPSGCGPECKSDIEQGFSGPNDINVPNDLKEIRGLTIHPITYTFDSSGRNTAHQGYTFSETNGQVGALIVNYKELSEDNLYSTVQSFDATGIGDEIGICGYRHNGESVGTDFDADVLVATTRYGATKAWSITEGATSYSDMYRPVMTLMFNNEGAVSDLRGVGCAQNRAVGYNGDGEVLIFNFTNPGKNSFLKLASDAQTEQGRAIALSGNGQVVAYYTNDTLVNLRYTSNGTLKGQVDVGAASLAGANLRGMELQYAAQTLWIATDDVIAKYDLTSVFGVDLTSVDDEGRIVTGAGDAAKPPAPPGIFTGATDGFALLFGGSQAAGGFMVGVILVLAFAGVGAGAFGGARLIMGGVGAAGGFGLAWQQGLFSDTMVFVLVVLVVGIVGTFIWRGRD